MSKVNYKDINGKEIEVGNQVLLEGDVYDIIVNPFNSKVVVDNECGQENLENVHTKCQVIQSGGNY